MTPDHFAVDARGAGTSSGSQRRSHLQDLLLCLWFFFIFPGDTRNYFARAKNDADQEPMSNRTGAFLTYRQS